MYRAEAFIGCSQVLPFVVLYRLKRIALTKGFSWLHLNGINDRLSVLESPVNLPK